MSVVAGTRALSNLQGASKRDGWRRSARTSAFCTSCGLVREWAGKELHVADETGRAIRLEWSRATGGAWVAPASGRTWDGTLESPAGIERHFGAELLLQASCCGGRLLWVRNASHLDYLEAYVASAQRSREFPSPPGDRTLGYKLPRWMKGEETPG